MSLDAPERPAGVPAPPPAPRVASVQAAVVRLLTATVAAPLVLAAVIAVVGALRDGVGDLDDVGDPPFVLHVLSAAAGLLAIGAISHAAARLSQAMGEDATSTYVFGGLVALCIVLGTVSPIFALGYVVTALLALLPAGAVAIGAIIGAIASLGAEHGRQEGAVRSAQVAALAVVTVLVPLETAALAIVGAT